MNKEFVWELDFEGDVKTIRCVLKDGGVVLYEDDREADCFSITNPEVKQGVLQIDETTELYGREVRFQLEKNVPYIKLGGSWHMSATTFEERKQKLLKSYKITAWILCGIGLALCAACGIRYLVQGTMGNWWFLLVLGSFSGLSGIVQYNAMKSQLKELEQGNV